MNTKKRVFTFIAVLALAAIIGILVWVFTRPENIDTIDVDEDVDLQSQIRVGSLVSVGGNMARGNFTILRTGEDQYSIEAVNFGASPCPELELYWTSTPNPTAISPNLGMIEITTTEASNGTFKKDLGEAFDPTTTEGLALWCASFSELFGNAAFSELIMVNPVISSGTWQGAGGQNTQGTIEVIQRTEFVNNSPVTRYSLRFQDLEVDAGPDLYLYLTPNPAPVDISVAGTVRVELDGIRFFAKKGNFIQDLDESITDPTIFKGAIVWCDRFSHIFGTTTLVQNN